MKKMKTIIALLIAMVMVLGLSTSVFAATITINQTGGNTAGYGAETYNLYKIFDVTKTAAQADYQTTAGGAGTEEGFSYTISTSSPWFAKLGTVDATTGVWSAATGQTWVTLTKPSGSDTVYNVTYTGANTAAGAKAFADWLYSQKGTIAADQTITSSSGAATTTTVQDGYWLIDSTLGTNLILATSDVVINTKNTYPSTTKTAATTNYNVGDYVEYTINVVLPATVDYTKPVTVHDTMDNVLSLVSAKTTTEGSTATDANHGWFAMVGTASFTDKVTLSTGKVNNHDESGHVIGANQVGYDFELDISSLAPATGETATEKTVSIKYYAELTSAAAADTGYVNKEFVEYSKYKTTDTSTEVKTYDFQLKKTFGGATNDDLQATFELADSEGNTIQFISDTTGYVKKDSNDQGASATLTVTGNAAGINVRGLKAGTYTLTEKTTSDGYNLITTPITITISNTGVATIGEAENVLAVDSIITVNNLSGTVLPSTGGIGTTIFYIIGAILVVGAGVVLVTRRRMKK